MLFTTDWSDMFFCSFVGAVDSYSRILLWISCSLFIEFSWAVFEENISFLGLPPSVLNPWLWLMYFGFSNVRYFSSDCPIIELFKLFCFKDVLGLLVLVNLWFFYVTGEYPRDIFGATVNIGFLSNLSEGLVILSKMLKNSFFGLSFCYYAKVKPTKLSSGSI